MPRLYSRTRITKELPLARVGGNRFRTVNTKGRPEYNLRCLRAVMTLVRIDPYSEGFEQWVFECGCGETLKQIKKIK
jgi:hypothetical protein